MKIYILVNVGISCQFPVSTQDAIIAPRKTHACSTLSLCIIGKVLRETVPMLVWLNRDCSQTSEGEPSALFFLQSSLFQAVSAVICPCSERSSSLKTSTLPGCSPVVMPSVLASLPLLNAFSACLCLVGLVVKALPQERKIPGLNPASDRIFPWSSHTSDLKIGTPVATLPGTWCYRVSAGTGIHLHFFHNPLQAEVGI